MSISSMELKDFRIGNYILQDPSLNGNDYCVVVAINEQHIRTASRTLEGVVYSPTPIPLTEKWLLNFGFKHDIYNGYIIQASEFDWEFFHVQFYPNNKIFFGFHQKLPSSKKLITEEKEYSTVEIRGNDFCFNLKYVHQLQNIYFSLTGEELKIK